MGQWSSRPLARARVTPAGFVKPLQPIAVDRVPKGPNWIHQLKHDGWRMLARRDPDQVHLWSRTGKDWTADFVQIAASLWALPVLSALLDGEVVAHTEAGLPDFYALQTRAGCEEAVYYAFDVLMIDGVDLRRLPLFERQKRLAGLLVGASGYLRFSEQFESEDGEALFRHACEMGLEGIVSKRRDSPYCSGPSKYWLKVRNPACHR